MKTGKWLFAAAMGVSCVWGSAVYAYKAEQIVKADTKDSFNAVVTAVHQQMAPGKRYEFVDDGERAQIDTTFADMQSLFDKYATVGDMPQPVKLQLFNDQETVNAILTRRDDKRLVCESVAPAGSHIPRTSCRTYREIEVERRGAQNYMDQLQRMARPTGAGH